MTHLLSLFYENPPHISQIPQKKSKELAREKEILYAKKLTQNYHPSRSATKHIDRHSTAQTLIISFVFCVDPCVQLSSLPPSSFSQNSKDKVKPAMVFSSSPLHLDPPKWNQQTSGINIQSDPLQILSSQPPPATGGSGGTSSIRPGSMVDRARMAQLPLPEPGLKCPRCDSTNTKFCYFNNYNLSQPRHFCKACRRYWTRGGALRNVPVGGGCRRNKRSKGRNKSAPAIQRRAGGASNSGGSNAVSSSPNTNTNSLSSQMLMLPPPPQPSFFPGLHHLNGYVGDFGLNLGGGGEVDQFEMGASRPSGVSRIHQLSNFFTGSDLTGNGLYPFQGSATQLDDTSDQFGEAGRVKMEGNNGVSLPNNMMGTQEDDDQYGGGWGSGNGWTDISGFHGSSSAGHLL